MSPFWLSVAADAALGDRDGDRVDDDHDVCMEDPDPTEDDADGDGFGDVCDAGVGRRRARRG